MIIEIPNILGMLCILQVYTEFPPFPTQLSLLCNYLYVLSKCSSIPSIVRSNAATEDRDMVVSRSVGPKEVIYDYRCNIGQFVHPVSISWLRPCALISVIIVIMILGARFVQE